MKNESMCRICAEPTVNAETCVNFSTVSEIYYKLIVSQPDEMGLPDIACHRCHSTLIDIDNFRKMCLEAYDQLKETVHLRFESTLKEEEKAEVEFLEMGVGDGPDFDSDVLEVKVEKLLIPENSFEIENHIENETTGITLKNVSVQMKKVTKTARKRQRKVNEAQKKFPKRVKIQCDQCDKFFYEQKRYEGHMRVHAGLKPAVCDICHKTFSKWAYLKEHRQVVHEPAKERLACEVPGCGRTFTTKHHLKFHHTNKHTGPPQPKSRHMCEQCGKTFTTVANLKIHKYSHGGKLPFPCTLCGKRMESNFKLKIHMMRHKGIKQHTCPVCGMKKTTITELKTHMNYHTRDKKYPCETCGVVFYSTGNRLRHVRIVHQGIKAYSCTYCDLSFGKAETLKHHVMTHTGEKPHVCDLCGKRFIQPTALQTHKKTHLKKME
ncbi:zinc finger protein 502-like isoform X2 [Malaya genurostris]|uniref:zinc finger protein 502-like isoform X2 n=1 Tax=Malaya genurostris TaxID=325434 RepID=UPI0026F38F71|nr:zinc finger protein 502-like isoform X2 [Malaya genurostris]